MAKSEKKEPFSSLKKKFAVLKASKRKKEYYYGILE